MNDELSLTIDCKVTEVFFDFFLHLPYLWWLWKHKSSRSLFFKFYIDWLLKSQFDTKNLLKNIKFLVGIYLYISNKKSKKMIQFIPKPELFLFLILPIFSYSWHSQFCYHLFLDLYLHIDKFFNSSIIANSSGISSILLLSQIRPCLHMKSYWRNSS